MEKTNKLSLSNVLTVISVFIGIHYFLSYRWLHGLLHIWGIESLSIITVDDLLFSFAEINIRILLISMIGFSFVGLFLLDSYIGFPSKKIKEYIKKSWKNFLLNLKSASDFVMKSQNTH